MKRKVDHLKLALNPKGQSGCSGFDQILLDHYPLTELNFEEIDLTTFFLGHNFNLPLMISCMTGGGGDLSKNTNLKLASLANTYNIPLGLGSMRSVLENNKKEFSTFTGVRKKYPKLFIVANLGAQQLVGKTLTQIQNLVGVVEANALAIHLNPLQEIIQPEGDRNFAGIVESIAKLQSLQIPIILKETGCGFGVRALEKIKRDLSFVIIDIAGLGGTHFGKIEQARSPKTHLKHKIGATFATWGIPTSLSLTLASKITNQPIIASGGMRNGMDVVKALCMGAQFTSMAYPFLQAIQKTNGYSFLETIIQEIKTSMFLVNAAKISELNSNCILTND